jgi:hypothetical protein
VPTYARIVRVSVTRGGGIAGLVRTTTADVAWLSPRDGREMQALVRQAGLLGDPPAPATGEPTPDQFNYTVTVEDEGRRYVARFPERSVPEQVRNLISWVRTVDGHREDVGPPGPARPLPLVVARLARRPAGAAGGVPRPTGPLNRHEIGPYQSAGWLLPFLLWAP